MEKLICDNCHTQNEIINERVTFCKKCNKKLSHNFTDWKQTKSTPNFEDYLTEFNAQNEAASKKVIILETEIKKKKSTHKDLLKLVASFVIICSTFIFAWLWQQHSLNDKVTSHNNHYLSDISWNTYKFGDSLSITLPFAVRNSPTIVSPFLTHYTHSITSKRAESSESFSVTIEEYELSNYFATNHHEFYNLQDLYVLESNAHVNSIYDSETMKMKTYDVDIAHNTFVANNNEYISDNYTLIKGNKGIKVIISYLKSDKLLNKYADIVNESLYKNA